jgi:hypothetical protein
MTGEDLQDDLLWGELSHELFALRWAIGKIVL